MSPNRTSTYVLLSTIALALACNGDDSASTESDSATASTSATSTSTSTTAGSGSASMTAGTSTSAGSASESNTGTSTTTASSTSETSGSTAGSTTAVDPTTSGTSGTSTTGADTDTTTTGGKLCEPGDDMMMGMVEKSFLWVANTDQGSLSKVDTQMLKELARYRSGPGGGTESPSRTAVSIDGRFVVVNNRGTGRVTMVAADVEDCVDKNNNGMIDTSQSPGDLRAWDADECVLWSIVLPVEANNVGAGPRGVTWTPGTWSYDECAFVEPKLWVGYRPQAGVAHMAKLNGLTGAVEDTVVISPWNTGDTYWGPYGAALDKDENVWFTGLRGNLYKLETQNNNALTTIASPGGSQFYGMTVDLKGRSWTAGCVGPVNRYDPMTQQWTAVPGTGNDCLRGIGADKDGGIWAASNGSCGVYQIDADTATLIKFHALNPCSTPVGISVDDEGFIFVVDEWQGAWKIDPNNTDNKQFLPIANQHYTYSDMTGGQLKGAILPQ